MKEEFISDICKTLGDVNRLKIILLLTSGELCACKLLEEFQITQPTLSHHMKILSESHLVNVRKEGKRTYYSLNHPVIKDFKHFFETLTCSQCSKCKGHK